MEKLPLNQEKATKYINAIIQEIKTLHPKKILLFGSRAKGYFTPNSDIDIAVDINLTFREKRKLKERVEEISGLYSVDLLFLPDLGKELKEQIEKEGIVLYEKE